jgi:large subunit ribosomal protein L32
MPQEPKKRHSRQRQGKRRAAIHLAVSKLVVCQNCKKEILAHKVCKYCGFYKGKEIINKAKKEKKKQTESES